MPCLKAPLWFIVQAVSRSDQGISTLKASSCGKALLSLGRKTAQLLHKDGA